MGVIQRACTGYDKQAGLIRGINCFMRRLSATLPARSHAVRQTPTALSRQGAVALANESD